MSPHQIHFLPIAYDIARYHHERFDGRGYPVGLRGDEIPLAARITSVADVYDALTTERVYKPAMSHEQAVEIILDGCGTQFDPDVVDAFGKVLDQFAELAQLLCDSEAPKSTPLASQSV
jgi:putative two-component system response regulator